MVPGTTLIASKIYSLTLVSLLGGTVIGIKLVERQRRYYREGYAPLMLRGWKTCKHILLFLLVHLIRSFQITLDHVKVFDGERVHSWPS